MKAIFASLVLLLLPVFAVAQTVSTSSGLGKLLSQVLGLINLLIPLMLALAVLFFFWGLVQYLIKSEDETARENAKQTMIWGIIAIAVMVSVFGLVGIVQDTFGLRDNTNINIPKIQI